MKRTPSELSPINLTSLGMEKGQMYEVIISTMDDANKENAAPIGILCKNINQIVLYLYDGTHTLENIKNNHEFVVNITQDPLLFTKSTLGDLPKENFSYYKHTAKNTTHNENYPCLKDCDAFCIANVEKIKEITKTNDLGSSQMFIITANIEKIVKNKECIQPLNRGIYAVIESLIHFTRFDLANDKQKDIYWHRIKEMNRIAKKVGNQSHKESMREIINSLKEKYGLK